MKYIADIDWSQKIKAGQKIGGDRVFLSRTEQDERNICILSDGLGSGVKANVLATMTGRMAQRYVEEERDLIRAAEIIMNTLPVCRERRISYATFTICDISPHGEAHILEYDNPPYILLREGKHHEIKKREIILNRPKAFKEEKLLYSEINLHYGDRLIFFSDGVTQAGLGSSQWPLGWRQNRVLEFTEDLVGRDGFISSRNLVKALTNRACILDKGSAKDDITGLSLYYRQPRETLVVTGPPMDKKNDKIVAHRINNFTGNTVVAGGTTANFVSRELKRKLTIDLKVRSAHVPPISEMEGVTLVTEGMLTLNRVAEILEKKDEEMMGGIDGASLLASHLINSDRVHFLVGTRINEAHQDPSVPFEIGIRRSIVKRITHALECNYLKKTIMEYI